MRGHVLGETFAGYELEEPIGRGGMSEVYRARNPRLGNLVALKLLAPELNEDDVFRERFVRESQIAASLDHPNVIPIFDAGEADGVPYIAMRYIDGPDLGELIKRGELPLDHIVSIVGQVAGALDAAHERGLIHRDVKPANILIDRYFGLDSAPHVYLSDFGVAKHTLSRSGLTSTGQFVGTIDYVSPEQIEGKPVDSRTDVYSLGLRLLRVPHAEEAVRARVERRGDVRAPVGASADAERARRGASQAARRRCRQGNGQGA